ncbi:hypothetical protein [Actinomadura rudentiformis]|uniref:Uncharacterized protein n=1 Tax=Actinomadura rudentiformis TaxID=359158 RepID=A0A6H9YSJ0_9ACTN|nr:hypothetical protein [Actinomadura rudentiformis]KAB2346978.1 hypothetical protein F8566_22615 [Actinomadura rudentiformis]
MCAGRRDSLNPDANAPDTPDTRTGYETFHGAVTVDKAARTVVVTVESSLVRDQLTTIPFDHETDRLAKRSSPR